MKHQYHSGSDSARKEATKVKALISELDRRVRLNALVAFSLSRTCRETARI
jgi:hypothetical protein